MWYEWNSGTNLRESHLKIGTIGLPPDEQLPLLIIPLKLHFAAFMITCEKRITLYRDILTGSPSRYVQHLDAVEDPEEPGSSGRQPIWIQWARPMRTPKGSRHVHFDDAIYLCREDGIVQYLELYNILDHMLDSTHPAGRLGINVNTAFAILDVGPGTDDMLATGGDMSEGGLWYFGARVDPTRVTTIPNWTPLVDFATVINNDGGPTLIRSNPRSQPQQVVGAPSRMFACTGRGKHGAISELRYGIKALKTSVMVNLDEEVDNGVLGIWAFHGYGGEAGQANEGTEQQSKDAAYVLISYPTRTSLLRIQLTHLVQYTQVSPHLRSEHMYVEREAQLISENLGIDYDTRTITSAVTPDSFTIQVTENSIRATRLPLEIPRVESGKASDNELEAMDTTAIGPQACYVHQYDEPLRILAASIHTLHDRDNQNAIYNDTCVLLALKISGGFELHLGRFSDEYQLIATTALPIQPVCLLLQSVCGYLLAVITTVCGSLLIYVVDPTRGLLDSVCHFEFEGQFAICDSVAVISSDRKTMIQVDCLVVCGLRNGSAVILRLTPGTSCMSFLSPYDSGLLLTILGELLFHEQLAIGHTSVTVMPDSNAPSRAIISCENVFCALEYPNGMEAPATVSNIWISDDDQPLLQIGCLSAVTQAVSSWVPGNTPGFLAGSFLCVDGKRLHTVSLEPKSPLQMVPRRIPLGGGPTKIIHSTRLNKLIVLYNKMTVIKERLPDTPGERSLVPSIVFLDPDKVLDTQFEPDAMDITDESFAGENKSLMGVQRKAGEKFLGITEWSPRVGHNEYHMLVVNTVFTKGEKLVGRLLIFAIPPSDSNTPRLKFKKRIELDAPVYAVATYGEKSLVYCCGSELCMQTLAVVEPSSYKWPPPIRATTRSPGRFLTVAEPLIHVSSTQESLAVFKWEGDRLKYKYGHQSVRDGLHHVHIPEHSLVLASDMSSRVIGLWQPPKRRIDNTMPTVFEAVLPGSITRFRHINRPFWHRNAAGAMTSDALIGSSMDGSITQFSIVEKGWRLLRFLQNMAERNKLICPYTRSPRKRHIDPSTARPTDMHINGDILQRVMDRGGEKLLREMLDAEPNVGSDRDFESAEARWARFKELSEEIAADADFKGKVEEAGAVWEQEWASKWVTLTMMWIRYQLRSAL